MMKAKKTVKEKLFSLPNVPYSFLDKAVNRTLKAERASLI